MIFGVFGGKLEGVQFGVRGLSTVFAGGSLGQGRSLC